MVLVRRAYAIGALAWLAMLPLGTFAATRVHASGFVHAVAFAIYSIGSLVCHQLPARSFHLWAAQLPVCARCTGIYVGAAVSAIAIPVAQAFRPAGAEAALKGCATITNEAALKGCATITSEAALKGCAAVSTVTRTEAARARAWMLVASMPTVATLAYEWTTGDMPSNALRFAAGLPLGAVVSWLILRVN